MATKKPKPNSTFSVLSEAEQRRINQMSPAELRAHNQAQRGGGVGAPTGGAAPAAPVNFKDPVSVSGEVARQGLAAGSDPTTRAAQGATQNILAGQGGAGSGTGFQHFNPINDILAQRLLGEQGDADELIRQFLGGAGQLGGGGGSSAPGPRNVIFRPAGTSAAEAAMAQGGGAAGAGIVPDTIGGSNAFFATELKKMMDSGASDADIQAVIDAANADTTRGMQDDLWALDAAAQGAGRLGGDTWTALGTQARADAAKQMLSNASGVRLGEVANRRAMFENLLGQVNTRDLAAMQDRTQRLGIESSARAAGSAGAGADEATRRSQDLQALGMLLNNQQGTQSLLAGLGGQLSGDQIAAINMAPGLAGINLSGLGQANNAAGNMVSLRGAQIQGGTARAALGQQAAMFNSGLQQQQLNDYLRNILQIGSMGGTSTTQGTNVVPGLGVNPTGAAIQGGLGAGLAAYGYGR